MKYLIEKDKKRRLQFEKDEMSRILFKALSKDKRLSFINRLSYRLELSKFNRNSSKTRIKNRCVISGRGRSVFRDFRMSRLMVRDLFVRGFLVGVRKSSW